MNDTDTRAPARSGHLPPALTGERFEWQGPAGRLSCYTSATAGSAAPLLLVHSINAAGSAYEVRPLYDRLRGTRTVYAPDLPGFGFSDRSDRPYTPRLMTDAVHDVVDRIRERHGGGPVDVVALSLSSEFVARAAAERPDAFRSIALVSPTGFSMRSPVDGPDGSNRGMAGLYRVLSAPVWRRGIFGLLTRRGTIRYFLQRTYGAKQIDEDLLDYDYLTTHVPGAENAPLLFVSGFLFSRDIGKVYSALQQPVWMTHGVRGDFTDYRRAQSFATRPNWRVDVWETGALPHFERPDEFARACETFLADPKGFVGARP
jgi:pimeloyl-ACP methyl ester carboxylesterase